MKSFFRLFCLVSTCLLICGCPYESEVPLEQPIEKLNPAILGRWKSSSDYYILSAKDVYHYNIAVFDSKESEPEHYLGYLTTINGLCFMNAWEKRPQGNGRKYFFAKLEMKGPNQMVVSMVTENITERFKTSAALKKFFSENTKNSYFFDKDKITFIRIAK